MLALSPIFILLLTAIHTSTAHHLPSRFDPSRIRHVHRRHHARRAQADCDTNIATGGTPIIDVKRTDAESGVSLVAVGTNASSAATDSAAVPELEQLIGESSKQAESEVVEVVKDAIEDVVSPALAKALNAVSAGSAPEEGESGSTGSATSSDGVYIVDTSDIQSSPSPAADSGSQYAPAAAASPSPSPSLNVNNYQAAPAAAAVCNQGDWRCDGMTLKRCNWNDWIVIRQCTGDNIVCSDQGSTVGCVWTWSANQQAASSPSPPVVNSPSPPAVNSPSPPAVNSPSPPAVNSPSQAAPTAQASPVAASSPKVSATVSPTTAPTQNAAPATTTPPPSPSLASTGTSPVPTSTFINDQGEECTEWEEEVWEEEEYDVSSTSHTSAKSTQTSSTPSATSTLGNQLVAVSPSATASSAAATASATASADDEDCEEWEYESSHSSSHSSTASVSSGTASATSQIGNNHAAAPISPASAASATASPASTTASPTASPSASTTTTTTSTSESLGLPSQALIAATISASNEVLSSLVNPSKTLSIVDVSAIAISSISTTSAATQGVVTATPSSVASYSAPHYVIYSDYWLFSMPDVSTLKAFNRFVLAFWLSDQGPVDNAIMWTWMSAADRNKTLTAYHNAGIALMVSAFGSTDQPTTMGKDPLATAQALAKFVVDYGFDGVDIDYEDMGAMNSDKAEAWLIPFQRELRRLLPSPYLISHAPVAPWFTSSSAYRSGAYVSIHQTVGDGIDFYNMQFYNQGDGVYTDCNTLINQSGGYWPGTSVMEMNSYAKVPLNKIVIGKPLDAGKASNGYMSPQDLNVCVKQARNNGWNGGVMFWEWTTDAPGIMATARA